MCVCGGGGGGACTGGVGDKGKLLPKAVIIAGLRLVITPMLYLANSYIISLDNSLNYKKC